MGIDSPGAVVARKGEIKNPLVACTRGRLTLIISRKLYGFIQKPDDIIETITRENTNHRLRVYERRLPFLFTPSLTAEEPLRSLERPGPLPA